MHVFFPTYLFRMFYVVYFDGGTAHINHCHTMLYLFTLFYCKVTLWGMSMSDVLINTALIQFKLSSSSLPEHRVLTTVFHSLRSCALCLASPQEIPYVRSSVSRLLLQVVVGRPRLRSLGGSTRVPVLWCWLGPIVECAQPITISAPWWPSESVSVVFFSRVLHLKLCPAI